MKILSCHSRHNIDNYHKSKITSTRFYCFINGKIKKELEKTWIKYKCSKNAQFRVFPWQVANSAANGEFCGTAWKSACRGILLALLIITHALTHTTTYLISSVWHHSCAEEYIYNNEQSLCVNVNVNVNSKFTQCNSESKSTIILILFQIQAC